MASNRTMAVALATALAVLPLGRPVVALDDDKKPGVDAEGYIGAWLVLAPLPLEENQSGAEGLDREQVEHEADLKPKAGDKVEKEGKELAWKEAETEEGVLDFNKHLGKVAENSVAYAVTTLVVDEEKSDVTIKVGSDDQVRIYLNGKKIHSNDEARSFEKDEDTVEGLTLKKGRNVLVVKVVNEGEEFKASVRVLDKDGAKLPGLSATIEPE